MAMTVYKDGKVIKKWSTTAGNTEFNEHNEQHKSVSLYNVEREENGLSGGEDHRPLT